MWMNNIFKNLSLVLVLACTPTALVLETGHVQAQAADPAVAQIQGFYDALTASMKSGGSTKSRFDKLRPAVERAFDLQTMTETAVGPSWASASDADKKALVDAFTRMTVADYAKNFDSYDGEKFIVEPAPVVRGSDHFVKSTMKTSKDSVAFNYRMHQVGSDWKVTDVLLAGNISQMAEKRSDFASTLASSGPQGLAKKINALADQMLA
jgi:phospholipid transport system substrate-binding protein